MRTFYVRVGILLTALVGLCIFAYNAKGGTASIILTPQQCTSAVQQCGSSASAPTGCVALVSGAVAVTLPTASGGNVSLAVTNCSAANTITYNWLKNSSTANTNASWTDTLPANSSTVSSVTYSYQVQACSNGACAAFPTVPLTATVPVAGGGGGFTGTCPGFTNTIVLTPNWANPVRLYTGVGGVPTFGPNDALVIQFTTGNVSTTTSLVRVASAEYNSPPSARVAKLSATPCDFNAQSAPGANMQGNSITASFAITPGTGYSYYPVLNRNTTYYVNLKNDTSPTCASGGICDVFVDLLKPGGL